MIVCILFDLFDFNGIRVHYIFSNINDYGNYFRGICSSSYSSCCPMQFVGCNKSITFCMNNQVVTECGSTRLCTPAWTFNDIAKWSLVQLLFIQLVAIGYANRKLSRNYDDRDRVYLMYVYSPKSVAQLIF